MAFPKYLVAAMAATSIGTVAARGCWSGSCTIPRNRHYYRGGHRTPWSSNYHNRQFSSLLGSVAEHLLSTIPYEVQVIVPSSADSNSSTSEDGDLQHVVTTRSFPRHDLQEFDDLYVLTLEVPGVSAENLNVELEADNLIRVSGSRQFDNHRGGQMVETKFDRSFRMEDVDAEKIKVTLSSGILKVFAPKKERQIKQLEILSEPVESTVQNVVNKKIKKRTTKSKKQKEPEILPEEDYDEETMDDLTEDEE